MALVILFREKARTSRCEVVVVAQRQTEGRLQRADRGGVVRPDDGVDVRYDGFDVCGAVRRHVLPDRLEVSPEVTRKMYLEIRTDPKWSNVATYTIACTTAEDAYPAVNTPGLLHANINCVPEHKSK